MRSLSAGRRGRALPLEQAAHERLPLHVSRRPGECSFQDHDPPPPLLYINDIAGIREPLLCLALKLLFNARSFLVSLSRFAITNTGVAVLTKIGCLSVQNIPPPPPPS